MIFTLLYTDTELQHLLAQSIDKEYIQKAITLVQSTLNSLQQELQYPSLLSKPKYKVRYRWTESVVYFVELVYSLIEVRAIEYGNVEHKELAAYLGSFFGIDVRDSKDSYMIIKKRRDDSRTYFLDRLSYAFNKKMNLEDNFELPTPPKSMEKTLFDDY